LKKIILIILATLFVACGVDDSSTIKYGIVEVSAIGTGDSSNVAMKFKTEKKIQVKKMNFSVFGLDASTDFSLSDGCTWDIQDRAIVVTCADFWISPDVGQRFDIWITGKWDVIELNSIVAQDPERKNQKIILVASGDNGFLRWSRVVTD
jgi:hypothetical protein